VLVGLLPVFLERASDQAAPSARPSRQGVVGCTRTTLQAPPRRAALVERLEGTLEQADSTFAASGEATVRLATKLYEESPRPPTRESSGRAQIFRHRHLVYAHAARATEEKVAASS